MTKGFQSALIVAFIALGLRGSATELVLGEFKLTLPEGWVVASSSAQEAQVLAPSIDGVRPEFDLGLIDSLGTMQSTVVGFVGALPELSEGETEQRRFGGDTVLGLRKWTYERESVNGLNVWSFIAGPKTDSAYLVIEGFWPIRESSLDFRLSALGPLWEQVSFTREFTMFERRWAYNTQLDAERIDGINVFQGFGDSAIFAISSRDFQGTQMLWVNSKGVGIADLVSDFNEYERMPWNFESSYNWLVTDTVALWTARDSVDVYSASFRQGGEIVVTEQSRGVKSVRAIKGNDIRAGFDIRGFVAQEVQDGKLVLSKYRLADRFLSESSPGGSGLKPVTVVLEEETLKAGFEVVPGTRYRLGIAEELGSWETLLEFIPEGGTAEFRLPVLPLKNSEFLRLSEH